MSIERFIIWLLLVICDLATLVCFLQIETVPGNRGYKEIGIIVSLGALALIALGMGIAGNPQPPI